MLSIAVWTAFMLADAAPKANSGAPPTAQELGYPKDCVALYGGTGGVHLI